MYSWDHYVHTYKCSHTTSLLRCTHIYQCPYHLHVVDYCLQQTMLVITANTHHPQAHCPTLRHSQEEASLCGEHTERVLSAWVGGNREGLTGGGGRRYSDSVGRLQHAGMPYTNLNTHCTHKSTLMSHHPLSRTQLTWGNSGGRRAHREAACCPSRWTLCRAQGSGGDGCSEGEQSNTPQTLWWQLGTTLST